MTGKTELEHIKHLKSRVDEQRYYIEQLRSTLTGVKGLSYDKDTVQTSGSGDPMLDTLVKIQEAEEKLKKLEIVWVRWRVKCIDKIHRMQVGSLQKFLYLIYIDDLGIGGGAEKMGWSYEYGKKMHIKALAEYDSVKLSPKHPLNIL